jgi:hypothetical protein
MHVPAIESLPTLDITTWCPASKQELLSSWKKRGAMAVTSGLLRLNNT